MPVRVIGPNDVYYHGKILPRDKAAPYQPVIDPNVPYAGNVLPRDKVTPTLFVDLYNRPGDIKLNNGVQEITLPPDTIPLVQGKKELVMTHLLDGGVSCFERILRDPYKITFQGVLRMQDIDGTKYNNTNPPAGKQGQINNIFAQDYLNDVWNYVWLPDTVLVVKNSFLNGLGIQQIIVESMEPSPIPGSTNIPFVLSAWENVVGQSLIIT